MDPGHLQTVGNVLMIYVNLACYFLKALSIPHIFTSVRVSLRLCPRIWYFLFKALARHHTFLFLAEESDFSNFVKYTYVDTCSWSGTYI